MKFPEFNDRQLNRLSEFLSNSSILTLASFVVPNIFGIDRPNLYELVLGIVATVSLLVASLVLLEPK